MNAKSAVVYDWNDVRVTIDGHDLFAPRVRAFEHTVMSEGIVKFVTYSGERDELTNPTPLLNRRQRRADAARARRKGR